MYIPPAFNVPDPAKLARFIRQNSFATLITQTDDGPFASHLPLLFETDSSPTGRLVGHMARANPQWRHFAAGRAALIIFHGPHAYISPRWYVSSPEVPTWNYAAVHAHGVPRVIDDDARLAQLLRQTIRFYEGDGPDAWNGDLPAEFVGRLMKAIVGFEIPLSRLAGKFKLNQNRQEIDRAGVYAALSRSTDAQDNLVAALMREEGLA